MDIKFNWKYSLGMTVRGKRHTIYRDHDKKVQKEVHFNKESFWMDDDEREFKTEKDLSEAFLIVQSNKMRVL